MPTETTEMDFPVRIATVCIRQDSGGAGRFRGGLGYTKVYQALADGVTVSMRGDRHRTGPWGSDDGESGEPSLTEVVRRDGTRFNIPSKQVFKMNAGDSLVIHSAGGGGYGSPFARPAADVLADVLNHKVSRARHGEVWRDDRPRQSPGECRRIRPGSRPARPGTFS